MSESSAQALVPSTAGIILVGGYSRRMGINKAMLPLQQGAEPKDAPHTFVEHLVSLISPLVSELHVIARDSEDVKNYLFLPEDKVKLGIDMLGSFGPLLGLYSGLFALKHSERALALAVDMPLVQPEMVRFLLSQPVNGDELIVPRVQGIPQMLLSIYPRSILPQMMDCIHRTRFDLRALLEILPVRYIEEDELRTVDPDLHSFMNVNTPEDLANLSDQ